MNRDFINRLKDWQTLSGAILGFAALCMTSYVTGCQQRQQISAQQNAAAKAQQTHIDTIRDVFLAELIEMHATCKDNLTFYSDKKDGPFTFVLQPYDERFQQFFGGLSSLSPKEIFAVNEAIYFYTYMITALKVVGTAHSLGDGFSISDTSTKDVAHTLLTACETHTQTAIATVGNFLGKTPNPELP